MVKCDWAVLCDYAFLDASHKMCLIGVFDRIVSQSVPSVHHQAALALRLVGNPNEKAQVRVEIVRPTGGVLAKLGGEAVLGPTGSANLTLHFTGMPLPDFGIYAVNVYAGSELIRTLSLTVSEPPKQGNN
jgi:hypothetical protein